ncbi:hypothetical protein RJ640_000266 [Escallonia rubra]|uniref:CAAX prenyl protease 2/Lysostaphin resistance protein A-like domain-containing protein n=1 Tax=Escallonia rubra TaxID=112253 RepID=A0AA88QH26_9ASTE|nr:hypothetical protein RJ640_000266 [Escallonia rubra]
MVLLVHRPLLCLAPFAAKPTREFEKPLVRFVANIYCTRAPSFNCRCTGNDTTQTPSESFSVLEVDSQCDTGSTWSTMALYMFSLHIPLSFGGLSVVAEMLHQPVIDPQTEVLSILVIQTLELIGTWLLIASTAKTHYRLLDFSQANKLSKGRNWFLPSAVGLGVLVLLVFLTSLLADRLIGPKDVNNPILKEILSSGSTSVAACIVVYSFVTPLLEEIVYRGFLLTSLASTMKWQQAVVVSSAVFSAAHFSGENSIQLFIIGSILGCSYCWTGNLGSSIVIHSLYNALTLLVTFMS